MKKFCQQILLNGYGSFEVLKLVQTEMPQPKNNEYLMKVKYTGINRPEILQRQGKYIPNQPKIGLEAAGFIVDQDNKIQFPAICLLPYGSYSEYVCVNKDHIIKIEEQFLKEAASIPEQWFTAYNIAMYQNNVHFNDTVLIYGGLSGVGIALTQIVQKHFNGKTILTVGSEEKVKYCKVNNIGDFVLNYKANSQEQIIKQIKDFTDGVDIVFDCIGAQNYDITIKVLKNQGTWVLYGLLGGNKIQDFKLNEILLKNINLKGHTLQSKSDQFKKELINGFKNDIIQGFYNGTYKAVIDERFSRYELDFDNGVQVEQAYIDAHKAIESNENIGKILIGFK